MEAWNFKSKCEHARMYSIFLLQFLQALTNIGRRLASVADKERRNGRLRAELASLDLNLPARVWLPLHHRPHCVLRIPPHAAAVLNSKDKVSTDIKSNNLDLNSRHIAGLQTH